MIRKLLPLILGLAGLGLGIGGGLFLRPAPPEPTPEDIAAMEKAAEEAAAPPEYVKLNNQFIVPVMEEGRVVSMVILSLNLEVEAGTSQEVYKVEPKLRDAFLQVLFDHANSGGFRGSFTDAANMVLLRKALLETAVGILDEKIHDVLIADLTRQDS